MIAYLKVATIGAGALALAACTSAGTAERNTAIGAGLGAVAGAVRGCNQAGNCGKGSGPDNYDPQNHDSDGDGVVDARDRYPDDPRRW